MLAALWGWSEQRWWFEPNANVSCSAMTPTFTPFPMCHVFWLAGICVQTKEMEKGVQIFILVVMIKQNLHYHIVNLNGAWLTANRQEIPVHEVDLTQKCIL